MSLLTVERLRSQFDTDLTDAELQAVIDDEESWLAARIGPLAGERSETFYAYSVDRPLRLQRPVTTATVADDGTATDVVVIDRGWAVESTLGLWDGPVVVTYTPNDEAEVRRVVLELVRLTLTETGYEAERTGDYSYTKGGVQTRHARYALMRSLQAPPFNGSLRLTSSSYAPLRVSQVAS
ncbi:MAG TPA: hypothetical protein VFM74_04570 [Candidatus Limnocylindria bacterium]|nr:hypothetical protein [Candidatus Limnocylindria bacterium]